MIRSIFIIIFFAGLSTSLYSQQQVNPVSGRAKKIAPSLLEEKFESVRVQITSKNEFIQWMKLHFPRVNPEELRSNIYRVRLKSREEIDELSQSPHVEFIDKENRIPREEKALGAFDMTLNGVPAVQNLYDLDGFNLVASVKEKPFDHHDIDLKNRVILNNQFDEASTVHATMMATIIAGAGNSEPSGKGAAPAASVTTSDFMQLLPDDGSALQGLNVSVQNHSYGVGVENYYGIEAAAYDKHCRDFQNIVHVFSSGNEGNKTGTGSYSGITGFANLTGQFKVSKNTVAVGSADASGNVVPRSSRGPAYDGRVKPELVAFGDAGSSDAAAVVSGISLLIQQYYRDLHGATPSASLVKAVLINSANDVGRSEVDFETGFGNVDALGAIRTVELNNLIEGSIAEGGENIEVINVPAATHHLKVTITWSDVEASPNAAVAIVNDLDLVVRHVSSGNLWKPWVLRHVPVKDSLLLPAMRKSDHLNTIEQVTLNLPVSGDYEIIVRGYDVPQGPQSYCIAYEFEKGFEWTNPLQSTAFTANRTNFVRWRWSEEPAIGKLEYKPVDDADWVVIDDAVDLSDEYYPWVPPDSTFVAELKMTVNSGTYESEEFSVANPMALKVGYNCSDEALLIWKPVAAAGQYQLYRMGEQFLEPFLTTSDTFAILNANQKETLEYAVTPILVGMNGIHGNTINYSNTGVNCYFMNFLPRQQVVVDDAIFDLTIGTTYKLHAIVLERLKNGVPIEIETITPTETSIVLTDPNPEPGLNQYRVRLLDSNQELLYTSDYEDVFYARTNDIFVFPNPVVSGELLNIVVDDIDIVRLRLFDAVGRLMEEITDDGIVKTFDTTVLLRGTYVVEVTKANGIRVTSKVIVL